MILFGPRASLCSYPALAAFTCRANAGLTEVSRLLFRALQHSIPRQVQRVVPNVKMAPKIYQSRCTPTARPECNVFSHILPSPEKDPHPSDAPLFIDAATGQTVRRGELRSKTLELAYGFKSVLSKQYGGPQLSRGDVVLVFSPNSIAYPIVVFGIFAGGLKATLANAAYTPSELAHQYTDSHAKLVVAHPENVGIAMKMFESLKVDASDARKRIVVAGFGLKNKGPPGFVQLEDLLGKGNIEVPERFDGPLSHETALLCYSSGTTGKPKGVESTHRNLATESNMIYHLLPITRGKDVTIGVLPFFHIYGIMNIVHYTMLHAVPTVVMSRFDPDVFCRVIDQYKVTFSFIVPPILVVLARHAAVDSNDLSSLEILLSGAAPLGAGLTRQVTSRFKSVGSNVRILQGYGLTETSTATHILPYGDAERKIGSTGILLPNLESRLVTDDGEDAKYGEPGELWIRGPTVMKGYLNNRKATEECFTPDGWFKTGDIAVIDSESFTYITDRKKELIKYKGFQVPPAELEAVLLQHPDVADAGVVGIHSEEEATELPRAYVVSAKTLGSHSEKVAFGKEVAKWMEGRVSRHKYLRGGVIVIDAIPKSASGKILRRELRELAKREAEKPKAKL